MEKPHSKYTEIVVRRRVCSAEDEDEEARQQKGSRAQLQVTVGRSQEPEAVMQRS